MSSGLRHNGYRKSGASKVSDQAIMIEGCVQGAIGLSRDPHVVTCQGEIAIGVAGGDNLAVRLNGHGSRYVVPSPAEIGIDQAVGTEGCVQAAVGGVTCQGEIVLVAGVSEAGDDNLA